MALPWTGILAVEDQPTGDGRMIAKRAIFWEDGPWPLEWEPNGSHDAFVIGELSRVWRSGSEIRGSGVLHDDSADPTVVNAVNRVAELSEAGVAGVSVVLDSETVEIRVDAEMLREMEEMSWEDWERKREERMKDVDKDGRVVVASWSVDDDLWVVTRGRLRKATVTHTPAIVETESNAELTKSKKTLDEALKTVEASLKVSKGAKATSNGKKVTSTKRPALNGGRSVYTKGAPVFASGALQVHITAVAAASYDAAFQDPKFGPDGDHDSRLVWQTPLRAEEVGHWGCPFTVTDDGQIYGHLATRGRCHGGHAACLTAPDSGGDFSKFLTGEAVKGIPTGPIILDTTHSVNPDGTVKDYDHLANTGVAVADVAVGNDQHGTWVAGRVRPGVTKAQLAKLRGSALSGEWLPYGSRLMLAGILAVNNPGYLVQRREAVAASINVGPVGGMIVATHSPACCGQDNPDKRFKSLENALARALTLGVK